MRLSRVFWILLECVLWQVFWFFWKVCSDSCRSEFLRYEPVISDVKVE